MRNRIKFLGIIALVAILGLFFVACGGEGADPSGPGTGTNDPGDPGGTGSGGGGGGYVGGGSKPSTPTNVTSGVTSVSVKSATTVAVTKAVKLYPTVVVTGTTTKGVLFQSSDETVATVDQAGVVTAKNVEGKVTITVIAQGDTNKKATCEVTVIAVVDAVKATGIELKPTQKSIEIGQELTLEYTVIPANATAYNVTFAATTGDSYLETVTGPTVKGKAAGAAVITATVTNADDTDETATSNITVTAPALKSITLNKTTLSLSSTLSPIPITALVATKDPVTSATDLVWKSLNTNIMTINSSNGAMTAGDRNSPVVEYPADVTIRVESSVDSDIFAECVVTVTEPPVPALADYTITGITSTFVYNGTDKYDGTNSGVIATPGSGKSGATPKYSYLGVEGTSYTASPTAPKNAGTYDVTFTLPAHVTTGYAAQTTPIPAGRVVIGKKDPTLADFGVVNAVTATREVGDGFTAPAVPSLESPLADSTATISTDMLFRETGTTGAGVATLPNTAGTYEMFFTVGDDGENFNEGTIVYGTLTVTTP